MTLRHMWVHHKSFTFPLSENLNDWTKKVKSSLLDYPVDWQKISGRVRVVIWKSSSRVPSGTLQGLIRTRGRAVPQARQNHYQSNLMLTTLRRSPGLQHPASAMQYLFLGKITVQAEITSIQNIYDCVLCMMCSERFVQVVMLVIFLQYFGIKSWQRYQAKKVLKSWWLMDAC